MLGQQRPGLNNTVLVEQHANAVMHNHRCQAAIYGAAHALIDALQHVQRRFGAARQLQHAGIGWHAGQGIDDDRRTFDLRSKIFDQGQRFARRVGLVSKFGKQRPGQSLGIGIGTDPRPGFDDGITQQPLGGG